MVLPTGATSRVPSAVALWKPFGSANSTKTTRCELATPPLAIFCHFGKYDVDCLTCYEVESHVVGLTPFLLLPSFVIIRRPGNRRRLHHRTAHPFHILQCLYPLTYVKGMGVRGTTSASAHVAACRHASEEDCGLAIAAERADRTIIERMLQEDGSSGARMECLSLALQIAALRNLQLLAGLLVARGADINFEGGTYETALGAAILGGLQEMMEWLLQCGARIDKETPMLGTPLHAAALCGRPGIVSELISHGADVNQRAGMYETALQVASLEGNPAVVEILLVQGADAGIQGGIHGNAFTAAATVMGLSVPSGFPRTPSDIDSWLDQNTVHLQTTLLVPYSRVILLLLEALQKIYSESHAV
jgi:hypothetical protein